MMSTVFAFFLSDWFTALTDWLKDFSSNWWFLIIVFVIAFFDSIFPVVPSETMVIIGGVAAGQGDQNLLFVILAGATGAFLGDNTAYLIGDKMSGFIERRAAARESFKKRLDWADRQIHERGGLLLITARFIPGGRTALTISSGVTHQPRGWFAKWVAIAAVIWATYASLLGFIGGKAFEDDHTLAFLVAFIAAVSVTVIVEVVRHFWNKRDGGNDVDGDGDHDGGITDVADEIADLARDAVDGEIESDAHDDPRRGQVVARRCGLRP